MEEDGQCIPVLASIAKLRDITALVTVEGGLHQIRLTLISSTVPLIRGSHKPCPKHSHLFDRWRPVNDAVCPVAWIRVAGQWKMAGKPLRTARLWWFTTVTRGNQRELPSSQISADDDYTQFLAGGVFSVWQLFAVGFSPICLLYSAGQITQRSSCFGIPGFIFHLSYAWNHGSQNLFEGKDTRKKKLN